MPQLQHDQQESAREEHEHSWLGANHADTSHATCLECRARPDRACAACGAPARIWTEAGDGRHAVAWCAACHELLLSGRAESAPALVYLPVRRRAAIA